MNHFYITTPIYYVNDVPHLGHAYTTMVADALARFHRMLGDDVFFLTGTDEHGQKIQEAAGKRGLTPQALCDQVAPRFEAMWQDLGISDHGFIRTTSAEHKRVVHALWRRIRERNPKDLYLANYEGWYCVGCEAFYTESQLEKDEAGAWVCTTHRRAVNWVAKERSWFFRMSEYQARLLEHIERNPGFIQPESYRNEVVAFVKAGLRDLSVSRTSFDWGIEVPEADPEGHKHVIYVWMDALTNYLSGLGGFGEDSQPYRHRWPGAVHLIGKDILRFHAVYWPCFLLAAELPLPKTILCHGWWTIGGRKISKSIPATRVDPRIIADDLGEGSAVKGTGVDAVRYFLFRETPLGNDGDLVFENLLDRYNADLANDLGNLFSRSLTMVTKFAEQAPPRGNPELAGLAPHADLERIANESAAAARRSWEGFAPSKALEATWRLIGEANRYVDATQPWALAKAGRNGELSLVLHNLLAVCWWLRRLIAPAMPITADALAGLLGAPDAPLGGWPTEGSFGKDLPALAPKAPTPLYPRLDDKRKTMLVSKWLPAEAEAGTGSAGAPIARGSTGQQPSTTEGPAAVAASPSAPTITFDDFGKTVLRVGKVVAAEAVPKAKKLVKLQVDLGEAAPRTVVAGIAEAYAPDALIGRSVIVVANLEPATIRGIRSEGMLLAAGDETILGLSAIDRDVPPGTRVR